MADDADIAADLMEREMELMLRHRAETGPHHTGYCLWCGARLRSPLRWCDADCRDDWERNHARIRRS